MRRTCVDKLEEMPKQAKEMMKGRCARIIWGVPGGKSDRLCWGIRGGYLDIGEEGLGDDRQMQMGGGESCILISTVRLDTDMLRVC